MNKYYYEGPVYSFQKKTDSWSGVTMAPSKKKAISNLSFRYKKEKGLTKDAKILLKIDYLIEIRNNDYIYYDEEMRRIINGIS